MGNRILRYIIQQIVLRVKRTYQRTIFRANPNTKCLKRRLRTANRRHHRKEQTTVDHQYDGNHPETNHRKEGQLHPWTSIQGQYHPLSGRPFPFNPWPGLHHHPDCLSCTWRCRGGWQRGATRTFVRAGLESDPAVAGPSPFSRGWIDCRIVPPPAAMIRIRFWMRLPCRHAGGGVVTRRVS